MKRMLLFLLLACQIHTAQAQVIITEIMADPSPPAGLPEAEFIELRNIGDVPADLTGWGFSDPHSTGLLADFVLPPDTCLILTKEEFAGQFEGLVMGLAKWPSLNNAGDMLLVRNGAGLIMDSVHYDISMYGSAGKSQGGWSLERIDLSATCSLRNNWTASLNALGGTPGRMNSVNSHKPDLSGPQLISAYSLEDKELTLVFDEPVDPRFTDIRSIVIPENEILAIKFSDLKDTLQAIVMRQVSTGQMVRAKDIRDCAGNINSSEQEIQVAVLPRYGFLRINEVLFDPFPGMEDFVELINQHNEAIWFRKLQFRLYDPDDPYDLKSTLNLQGLTILTPGELMLISRDPGGQINYYGTPGSPKQLMAALFNIPDQGGIIVLEADDIDQDSVISLPGFHHALAKNTEGYSLERIDPAVSGWMPSAWSTASGGATPGKINSQGRRKSDRDDRLVIDPEVIYPYSHSLEKFLITLNLPQAGLLGTLQVYNLNGNLVATLAQNVLLGSQYTIAWEGIMENGSVAVPGYYLLYCLLFGPDGYKDIIKRRLIIGFVPEPR